MEIPCIGILHSSKLIGGCSLHLVSAFSVLVGDMTLAESAPRAPWVACPLCMCRYVSISVLPCSAVCPLPQTSYIFRMPPVLEPTGHLFLLGWYV